MKNVLRLSLIAEKEFHTNSTHSLTRFSFNFAFPGQNSLLKRAHSEAPRIILLEGVLILEAHTLVRLRLGKSKPAQIPRLFLNTVDWQLSSFLPPTLKF